MSDDTSLDPVAEAFTVLAKASFPQIYDEHGSLPLVQAGMYHRPDRAIANSSAGMVRSLRRRAFDAIARDPALKVLVEEPADHDHGVFVRDSYSGGWRLRSTEIVPILQRLAAQHVLAHDAPTDDVSLLMNEVVDLIGRLRVLLSGETSYALSRIAYEGIGMRSGVRLELPWGVLRAASTAETKMIPFGSKGPTVVLERWFPVELAVYEPPKADADRWEPTFSVGPDSFDPDLLAFALTLALGHDWPVAPRMLWRSDLTLLRSRLGVIGSFEGREYPYGPESPVLTTAQEQEVALWSRSVDDLLEDSTTVAVKRLLSSVRERSFGDEDSLIDAVISWENLFGHGGSTEMTFRITTAMAILLSESPSDRLRLQRRLKAIYNLRSTVAHGGKPGAKDNLGQLRDDAERFAVEALRLLFSSRSDLLKHPDRGMRLILGFPDDADSK